MPKKPTSSKQYTKSAKRINTEWIKNASRSLGMNSLSVIEDLSPNISDVAKTSTESMRNIVKDVRSNNEGTLKVTDLLQKNKYVKLAQKGLQNAMEDLKTGNFNNEERAMNAWTESSNEEDSGMFFDDSDTNDESSTNTIIKTGPSDASMAVVNKSIRSQTEAQLKGAKATVDTLVAVTSASMAQQQDLNARLISGLENINNNLAAMVSFQNETMNRFIESASTYMEKMGSSYDKSNEESGNKRIKVNDIYNSKGVIDSNKYKELVKVQMKDWFDETAPGMIKDFVDQWGEQIIANPLQMMSKAVIETAIPNAIKNSMKSIDESFGGFLPMFLERLGNDFGNSTDRGAKGEFKRAVGNIFGLRHDRKNEFDMSDKITETATPFSKVDHFAISELIPKYLRESNSYLKAIAESMRIDTRKAVLDSDVFDYKEGKYVKNADIQKNILKELTSSVTDSFRSSIFGKELVRMGNDSDVLSDKQKTDYEKVLNQFFVQLEKNGNPNITKDNTEGLDKILDNVDADPLLKNFLKMSVMNTISKRRGGINMGSAIRSANKSLNSRRDDIQNNASIYNLYSMLNGSESLDDSMMAQIQGLFNISNGDATLAGANGINIPVGGIGGTASQNSSNKKSKRKKLSAKQRRQLAMDMERMNPSVNRNNLSTTEKVSYDIKDIMYGLVFDDTEKTITKAVGSENMARMKETKNSLLDPESNNPISYLSRKLSDVVKKVNHEMTGEEYTDSTGKKIEQKDMKGKKVSLVDALKNSTKDVMADLKKSIFGEKNEEGRKEGGLPFVQFARKTFQEGINGYADALFGSDDSGRPLKERMGSFIKDKLEKAKNLVPKELRESLNQNGDAAVKGGLIGSLIGGPIVGGITGSAVGLFTKSKTFQEFLYGKENENGEKDGGLLKVISEAWNGAGKEDGLKIDGKKLSMAAVGTGAGFLASFFTPLGPVGGAALGLASSMIASNDKFKKFLFGSKNPDDDEPGLMKRFSNMFDAFILRPIKDKALSVVDNAKDFVKEAILDPIVFSLEPITVFAKRTFDNLTSAVSEKINNTFDFIKDGIKDFVTETSAKMFKTVSNFLSPVTKVVGGAIKGVASMPGKLLGKIGDAADKSNRKASRARVERENTDGKYDDLIARADAGDKDAIEEIETMYFASNFRNKNKAVADEEKKARKQKKKEDAQKLKDKRENEKFIVSMSGGAFKEDTEENRRKAMEIFKQKQKENKGKLFKSDKVNGYRNFEFKGDANVVESGDATQSETPTEETAKANQQANEQTAENTRRISEEIEALNEKLTSLLTKKDELKEKGLEIRQKNIEEGKKEFDFGKEYIDETLENQKEIEKTEAQIKEKQKEQKLLNPSAGRRAWNKTKDILGKVRYGGVRIAKIPRNAGYYGSTVFNWLNNKRKQYISPLVSNFKDWYNDPYHEEYQALLRQGKFEEAEALKNQHNGGEGGYGSPFTSVGHYVVASGMDNNGNLIINNPNEQSGSKKYNMTSVLNQTGRAWGLNKLQGGRGVLNTGEKDTKLHVVVDEIKDSNPIKAIITGTKGILPVFSFGTRRSTTNMKQAIDSATKSNDNLDVDDLAADFGENDAVMAQETEEKESIFDKIGNLISGLGGTASSIIQSIAGGTGVLASIANILGGSGGILGTIGKIGSALGITGTAVAGAGLALDYFKNNKDTNKNTFMTNEDGSLVLDENGNPVQMTEQNKPDQSRSTFTERISNWLTPNKTRVNTDKDSEDYGKWTTEHTNDAKTGTRASAGAGVTLKAAGTVVSKFLPLAKEAIETVTLKLAGLLEKHGMNATTVNKVLDFGGDIAKKITVESAEKHTSKISVAFAKIGASGGTLALADAAFIAIGALSGLTSAGELFEVNMDDENLDSSIKTKMRLISTVFKGFMNTSVGTIIDVVDIIVSEAANFSPIKWLAQQVLKLWMDDVDDEKLAAAQENMKSDYNASLQEEYEAYLAGLSDDATAMSYEEFSNSNLATDFNDYNANQNQSIFDRAGNTISKAWNGIKNAVSTTRSNDATTSTNASVIGANTMKVSNYTAGTSTAQAGGMSYGALNGGYGEKINGSTFYSQKDPRWKNAGYGASGDTMGNAGCGPTAMAMALSDATGSNINPMQMASMAQSGGFRDGTGTNASFINAASNAFGVSTKESINPNEEFIRSELSSGNPVVLLGQSGGFGGSGSEPFTSAGHFNYATGIDKDGNVTVNDPRGKSYSKKYKLNKLAKQTGRAWSLQSGRGPGLTSVTADVFGSTTGKLNQINQNKTNNEDARQKWIAIVKAVKQAIAQSQSGYSKEKSIQVTIGGKTLSVRTDCSGFVTACLKFFGVLSDNVNLTSYNYTNASNSTLMGTGFISSPFSSWESLNEGDIIATDGHVEIFAGIQNGKHMVYNVGSDSSANNAGPTVSAKQAYTTVWSPDGASAANATNATVNGVSYSADGTSNTISNSSSGISGIFSKITSFFSSAASKMWDGIMSGKSASEWSTDYSDVFGGTTSNYATGTTASQYSGPVTAATNMSTAEAEPKIYNYLRSKGYTKAGAAALMGNLYAESGMRPNNVQDSTESRVGNDTTYTANVDSGVQDFANDSAGYGLAQWTSAGRKQGLLDYARSKGTSISDLQTQLEWLDNEMTSSYNAVKKILTTTNDVMEGSNAVLHKFESPADQSVAVEQTRGSYGQAIYEKYANNETSDYIPGTQIAKQNEFTTRIDSGAGDGSKSTSVSNIRYSGDTSYTPQSKSAYVNDYGTTNYNTANNTSLNAVKDFKNDNEMKILHTITQLLESIVSNTGTTSSKLDYLQNIKSGGQNTNTFITGGNTVNNNSSYSQAKAHTYNKQYLTAAQISKG